VTTALFITATVLHLTAVAQDWQTSSKFLVLMSKQSSQILVVLVNNKVGVLSQISSLLRRRQFQILSLTVGETEDNRISRMTIVVRKNAEQVVKQLYKIIDVLKVSNISNDETIIRDTLLIKVNATNSNRTEVLAFATVFRTKTIDISPSSLIFELTAHPDKVVAFINEMRRFGIKEMVRSGVVAGTGPNQRRSPSATSP